MMHTPKIIAVVGATASGKSALAVRLAKKYSGEIISADSRQIYRGLDIGTGKVTKDEMDGIPHHMLDVASPKRRFSVAQYKTQAQKKIRGILRRKKLPIICGGTGFYINATVDNILLPDVSQNAALRKNLEKKSTEELYEILKHKDKIYATVIDRRNPRRLIRAIEIATALGNVPVIKTAPLYNPLFIGLSVDKQKLTKRIHKRLVSRMAIGMLDEVARLHKRGLSWGRMEELGLEYRYGARYLQGFLSRKEMMKQLETEIIHYAKRQHTWFKRDTRIHWIPFNKPAEAQKLISAFLTENDKMS